jgi:DNA repair protein RecO (recombination protein O)
MDETKNTTALILNRQPYRENDSLVTLYTPDQGKLVLVARGTSKLGSKLAGHIEPLTIAEIMIIRGKGRDYLGSALGHEVYVGIRNDLNKLYYAGRTLSLFSRLVKENEPDERLFFLLTDWLKVLDSFPGSDLSRENGELLSAFFTLKFLGELGYRPQMYKCLICGEAIKPGKNYFDLLSGGMVCASCREKELKEGRIANDNLLTISDNGIKVIRFILNNKLDQAEKLKIDKKLIKELVIFINRFLSFHF